MFLKEKCDGTVKNGDVLTDDHNKNIQQKRKSVHQQYHYRQ